MADDMVETVENEIDDEIAETGDNRPIAYAEDDKIVIRGSALGECKRALVAALLGYEENRSGRVTEILESAAGEGNLHEQSILDRLEQQGWGLTRDFAQDVVEWEIIKGVVVRGHIDGWCEADPDGEIVEGPVEVKTMSDARYKLWVDKGFEAYEKYAWQISGYMYAKGAVEALYGAKNRNTGVLDVHLINGPPIERGVIRRKVIEVLQWYYRGELPPCDPGLSGGDRYFCPFIALHIEDEVEDGYLDDLTIGIVEAMAQKHYELSQKLVPLNRLDKQRREVASQMKLHVTGKKTVAGEYLVTRIDNKTRALNEIALAADLGLTREELRARYSTDRPYSYFRVDKVDK
jgi:hypothetical protein